MKEDIVEVVELFPYLSYNVDVDGTVRIYRTDRNGSLNIINRPRLGSIDILTTGSVSEALDEELAHRYGAPLKINGLGHKLWRLNDLAEIEDVIAFYADI